MPNIQVTKIRTPIIARQWAAAVRAAGGGFAPNSLVIAANLARTLQTRPYYTKIKYLLPMLGVGMGAAVVPLIDVLKVGAATSVAFSDGDFGQSTGLQGDGSSKYLNSLIKPSQIGSASNGGMGYWENNINLSGNNEPIGCYSADSSNRYCLDLRNFVQVFRWGAPPNAPTQSSTAVNGHYYGQRTGATDRTLYLNGSLIATNTTSDGASGVSDTNMAIVGTLEPTPNPWPGRCAVAYFTDGTMTADEVANLHSILYSVLMVPTGKPTS